MPSTSPLLESLNEIQQQAVVATEGPSLILAGAGSGKTKVLTHRVAYLIKEKAVPAGNILVVTFTNKAAKEMMERITHLLGNAATKPNMGTFHSICAKILRKDGKHIGLSPSFTIYDENDAQDAIREAMQKLDISPKKIAPSAAKNTISGAKNEMISSLEYPTYARGYFQETVAKIYLEYQKILEKNQAVDFDDLLLLTVKLFQNHPQILTSYQILFRYILIDEYQDTNAVQYILSKLLAQRHRNISVVGDASQSIYAFRGADFRNIVNFKNDYPEAKVFHLEQNYRSTQMILDAAHSVISKNKSHPVLKLWTQNPPGAKIHTVEVNNETSEAEFIINQIQENQIPLSNVAVLYRTNAQSRSLEEGFLKKNIPYVLVGGIRFYERKEIKDVLAYLKLLSNPSDSIARQRIEKIGKTRASRFWQLAEEIMPNLQNYTTLELMDLVLDKTGYMELLDSQDEVDKMRQENVKELRSVAETSPNITEFLENVTLVESEYFTGEKSRNKDDKKEAVTLTTLHQAKGLEWPYVFMVGMEEGLFPHSRSMLDPAQMEEERRLCYVGITRAKDELFLTYARRRLYFGTRSNNLVSRFLQDLPQELIDNNIVAQASDNRDFSANMEGVSVIPDEDEWLNA